MARDKKVCEIAVITHCASRINPFHFSLPAQVKPTEQEKAKSEDYAQIIASYSPRFENQIQTRRSSKTNFFIRKRSFYAFSKSNGAERVLMLLLIGHTAH